MPNEQYKGKHFEKQIIVLTKQHYNQLVNTLQYLMNVQLVHTTIFDECSLIKRTPQTLD